MLQVHGCCPFLRLQSESTNYSIFLLPLVFAGTVPSGSSPRPHSHYAPLEIYSPHLFLASYPSPGSNGSHPASVPMVPVHGAPPPQWIYGDPEVDYYQQVHHHLHRQYYPPPPPPTGHHHHHVYDRAQSHRRRKAERSSAGRDGKCRL